MLCNGQISMSWSESGVSCKVFVKHHVHPAVPREKAITTREWQQRTSRPLVPTATDNNGQRCVQNLTSSVCPGINCQALGHEILVVRIGREALGQAGELSSLSYSVGTCTGRYKIGIAMYLGNIWTSLIEHLKSVWHSRHSWKMEVL